MDSTYFADIRPLPDSTIRERSARLIGFEARYQQVYRSLLLILRRDDLATWAVAQHGRELPLVDVVGDRHPLMILEGDVGTGKTVTAEGIADQMTRELRKEGALLKLSTRVRGDGLHGQMSKLIAEGFARLEEEAGKRRMAFLLIDEADAIATTRGTSQMHQEEKAAVNTLIQKLDDLRGSGGRAAVFLTTNRPDVLDQAVVRRAAVRLVFGRPTESERRELLARDLDGVGLTSAQIDELAKATGSTADRDVGFTFSDLRQRLIPAAVSRAFPDRPLTFEDLKLAARHMTPAPVIS